MKTKLNEKTIRHWAALGMRQRLREHTEATAELKSALAVLERRAAAPAAAPAKAKVRARRPMTAAQRKAVAIRMKKYWAERRRQNGDK
jgi:hypothetical protein